MSWKRFKLAIQGLFEKTTIQNQTADCADFRGSNQRQNVLSYPRSSATSAVKAIETSSLPRVRTSLAQPCMVCESLSCRYCPVYITAFAPPDVAMNDINDGGPDDPAQFSSSRAA